MISTKFVCSSSGSSISSCCAPFFLLCDSYSLLQSMENNALLGSILHTSDYLMVHAYIYMHDGLLEMNMRIIYLYE